MGVWGRGLPVDLSIIVILHNMRREAVRTLRSLSRELQHGLGGINYQIIAIDNGSSLPLEPADIEPFRDNVTHIFLQTDSVSPVGAVNLGAQIAKGEHVAVIVDGARMASPGLISASLLGTRLATNPFVFALSWHLGPKIQNISMLEGYDQAVEDAFLESIAWPDDGYRLFEISTIAPSSEGGFLAGVPPECSWFCMKRSTFLEMGGFEPGFASPGGGLVNHDFRNRVLDIPGIMPVGVLGEGVFHQFHGGVATNVPLVEHPWERFDVEYKRLRGASFAPIQGPEPLYVGRMCEQARRVLAPSYG
jgi:glycosyltransferase involved in cell wall biosynthesis